MGNVIIDYLEERGKTSKGEEIAINLLEMGMDSLDIIKATGISAERLLEIRDSLRINKVAATG